MSDLVLTPEQEAICQRTAELVLARMPGAMANTDKILTRPEARAHVKRPSEAAFCDWCRRWRVKPCSHGRYSRIALDLALDREARAGRRPMHSPRRAA